MKAKTISKRIIGTLAAVAAVIGLLGGCATTKPKKAPTLVPTNEGTVVFLEKYEFKYPQRLDHDEKRRGRGFRAGLYAV